MLRSGRPLLTVTIALAALSACFTQHACADPTVVALQEWTEFGPQPPFRVRLTDGTSYEATLVGPWPGDFVKVVTTDGRTHHIPSSKVAAILDAVGDNYTVAVVEERKTLPSESARPTPDSLEKPRPRLGGIIAQGALLFHVGPTREGVNSGESISDIVPEAELGLMGKIGEKWGVGATAFLEGNGDLTVVGLKGHVRRALGTRTFVDIAPGVIDRSEENGPNSSGFVAEATVMGRGVGFTAQVEAHDRKDSDGGTRPTEWWWYVGPKFEGLPGVAAGTLALLLVAILKSAD